MFTITKKLYVNFLFVLLFVLFFSCATTKEISRPDWISNVNSYPKDSLCAVGIGLDEQEASKNAIANLGRIIEQTIDAETVVQTTDKTFANGTFENSSVLNQSVKTTVLIDSIVGVKISDTWLSKDGTFYSLATLNKVETTMYYSQQINENNEIVLKEVEKACAESNLVLSIKYLKQVLSLAKQNEQFLNILYAVNKASYSATKNSVLSSVKLENMIKDFASQIKVTIVGLEEFGILQSTIEDTFLDNGYKIDNVNPNYKFKVVLEFEESNSETIYYSKYYFTGKLIDINSESIVLTMEDTYRAAHKRKEDAKRKAVLTLRNRIQINLANLGL